MRIKCKYIPVLIDITTSSKTCKRAIAILNKHVNSYNSINDKINRRDIDLDQAYDFYMDRDLYVYGIKNSLIRLEHPYFLNSIKEKDRVKEYIGNVRNIIDEEDKDFKELINNHTDMIDED